MNVTKFELVDNVAENIGVTKKDALLVLDALLETITETVANGEKVTLIGFGSFEAKKRAPRTGRNPLTGASIAIPAKTVPTFSAGKAFKELVNEELSTPSKN